MSVMVQVHGDTDRALERALRKFKRDCQRSGVFSDYRRSRFYVKPSEMKRRKRNRNIQRTKRIERAREEGRRQ